MNCLNNRLTLACFCATLFVVSSVLPRHSTAGENIELDLGTIYKKLWANPAIPIDWNLNELGVVNNTLAIDSDQDGDGVDDFNSPAGVAIPITDVETTLGTLFDIWENVPSSSINFNYAGQTTQATTGMDGVFLVTWSDPADFTSVGITGRGITNTYNGVDTVISNANRSTLVSGVTLDPVRFPNGFLLQTGTIIDADLSFNADVFNWVLTGDTVNRIAIDAVGVHEVGHTAGLAHSSLQFSGLGRPTMSNGLSQTTLNRQNERLTLEFDDIMAISRDYPGAGFFPTGVGPFNSGSISGSVAESDGTVVEGIRVWLYDIADTDTPIAETFVISNDDATRVPGSYIFEGVAEGEYYVAISPWNNGLPDTAHDSGTQNRNSRRALDASNNALLTFIPESFDDWPSDNIPLLPDFAGATKVKVSVGQATEKVDFILGEQPIDMVLVMDVSGSMNRPSSSMGVASTKLEALQIAANEFVDFISLSGSHRLGLLQFNVDTPDLTPIVDLGFLATATDLQNTHDAIDTMVASGGTNIIGAVEEAVTELTSLVDPNPRQSVFLFSDGRHNNPFGSDVNDIIAEVVNNDLTFYGIGFGSDVDSTVMQQAADDTNGSYVEEPSLDNLALRKHFLTVAASATDSAVVVDPRQKLAPGERYVQSAFAATSDRHLTFAVNWATLRQGAKVELIGPNKKVQSLDDKHIQFIEREHYMLLRINFPKSNRFRAAHQGNWQLSVTADKTPIDFEVAVFGSSPTQLFTHVDSEKQRLEANLLNNGKSTRANSVIAEIFYTPIVKVDSGKQDEQGADSPAYKLPEKKLLARVKMRERKIVEAGRQHYTYFAPLKSNKPGAYEARIVARYGKGSRQTTREKTLGFVTR